MKLIVPILLLFSSLLQAQVGIGTTAPTTDLHVEGSLLVQDNFQIEALNKVSPLDEDFKLLTRNNSSLPVGKVTELDVNARAVAPVNVRDYRFVNVSLDNLSDVDLQYDSSKYIVALSNFRYVGDAIKKDPLSGTTTFSVGNFVVRTFENGGSWHLEIKNRDLDLDVADSLEYHVTLVIYDRSFFRNMPIITTDLGGINSGTASSIPNLY